MKVRGLLLDLDDTLYAWAPCNEAGLAAVHALGDAGLDAAAFRALHDDVRADLARRLAGTAAAHDRALFFQAMAERAGVARPWSTAAAWTARYWAAFLDAVRPAPGAHEVLAALAARCPLAVVSNHTAGPQHAKLARLGFEEHLSALVTSEEVGAEKPDPRVFAAALARLGVDARAAAMVGDDPRGDVAGARAAGLFAVHCRLFTRAVAPDADATVERLEELVELFA
ncbi:MAG: HAD family hydrolase [Planctomycetes bacterium]|nr:HAD family hydrolase [Planctomycetota bacterium]